MSYHFFQKKINFFSQAIENYGNFEVIKNTNFP